MDLKKGEGVTQEEEGLQGLPLPISAYLQPPHPPIPPPPSVTLTGT